MTALEPSLSGLGGLAVGIGLSAACGFRIILPFLCLSVAALNGFVRLAPEFQWLSTWPALIALATAAILEIAAYYIPWLDNLLDSLTTPLAVAAGTAATASVLTDLPPLLRWALALIAGGGVAGAVQTGTALLRGMSTLTTGGAANFAVATAELLGALAATLFALFVPLLALAGALAFAGWVLWRLLKPGPGPRRTAR
jgi:hypothetical protein